MDIKNIGYNIGEVTIDTALTSGTPAEVGTLEDLQKLYNLAKNGGIGRINCTVGGTPMSGCCFLNPFVDANGIGVDIGGVTNFGFSANAVTGTAYVNTGKMYAVVTITPLGGAQAKSSTKSAKSAE